MSCAQNVYMLRCKIVNSLQVLNIKLLLTKTLVTFDRSVVCFLINNLRSLCL